MSVLTRLLTIAILCGASLLVSVPAQAQQNDDKQKLQEQLDKLQQQIDELQKQAATLQKSINDLSPASTGTTSNAATAPADDLLNVQPIENPSAAPESSAAPAVSDQQAPSGELNAAPVANAADPGASKVFNPDMSVIGNFLGHIGDTNPFDPRDTLQFDEAELAFEAFVDPYAKAKFFLGATEHGLDVEEGYAQFVALPKDFSAKVGKMKAQFGKANTWHTHVRPWVDQPLVIHNFFGDEGLADSGISVSKIIPVPSLFVEATGEIFRGKVEDVFDAPSSNDLFYNAHLKFFKDISENSNVEVGTSYASGTAAASELLPGGARSRFLGADFTYRWKPLIRATRQSFIGRAELIQNHRSDIADDAFGFYASGDYQLGQRWFTGLRLDAADHPDDPSARDRGLAATLTFWPSEFSQLRGEFRRVRYGNEDFTANELLLQLQFAIGAHGAHTF